MSSQVAFVIERKLQYHGIWNTGLQLTDQFIKTIAEEHKSKPSCTTFITLSSDSLSLVVFSKDGAVLRKDQIAFDALREVAVNSYSPKCLMILYVNNKNKYSVIVCSCQDNKEAVNISLAFKQLKNIRLVNQQKKQNWFLRRNSSEKSAFQNGIDNPDGNSESENGSLQTPEKEEDSISTRSRTPSGVMNDTFAFLNNEDDTDTLADDEEVFSDLVEREPVSGDDSNASFHVGIQVDSLDRSDELRSSRVSFQSMKSELDAIAKETDSTSSDIADEEYYKTVAVNGIQENGIHTDKDDGDDKEDDIPTEAHAAPKRVSTVDSDESYEFRSIGTMAATSSLDELGGSGRRYKKRPGSMGSSNAYKQMAAQRKHTALVQQSSAPSQPTTSMAVPGISRARPASYHGARPGVSYQSLFLPRQVHVSTTSVSRPIEQVYHSLRKKRAQTRTGSRKMVVQYRNAWFPTQ